METIELSPDLKTGQTWAFFQDDETIASLNKEHRVSASSVASSLRTQLLIESGPIALPKGKVSKTCLTSRGDYSMKLNIASFISV